MESHLGPLAEPPAAGGGAAYGRLLARIRGGSSLPALLLLPLLLVLIGYPLFLLVTMAFNTGDPEQIPVVQFGLGGFPEVLQHLNWVANSLLVSVSAMLLATGIAVVLAWILYRTTVPGRRVFEVLVAIPYPIGPLVGALAWSELGSPRAGLLNQIFTSLTGQHVTLVNTYSVAGIVFVMAIFEAPVAVLMIGAAMRRMDPSLEECSMILGAGNARTALRITLPLMLPAILSAALFLFASMMGAFAIPTILGANSRFYVATTAIYMLFQGYPPDYPLAAALGVVMIAITVLAVLLYGRAVRGRSYAVISGRTYRPRPIDMRGWTPFLFLFECLYVLIALVLPLGVLILASFQHSSELSLAASSWTLQNYHYVLIDFPTTREAIVNSLILGVGTGTLGVALATVIAWVVYRTRGRGRGLLEQVTMAPQAMPRLILAVGLLWMVLTLPINIYGTIFAVLLAYVIVFLPLAFRTLSGVVVQIDRSLEEASRVVGAGWLRTMASINLPLLRSGLLAAWVLLFMISVREVSASLFLSGASTRVLGPAIFNFWDSGGLPRVSALAVVQAAIVLVALLVVRRVTREEMSA
ncbi:iron ABC transporter permease [bacterium]|nr:MAG: iron ABC transporter permease [bacterium]